MTTTLVRDVSVSARPGLRYRAAIAPLGVGLLGFLISVVGITTPSVWYDESATITSATRSWPQLAAELGNVDAVHALYYVVMHLVFDLFGYSPLTLRLPSAIAVGVTGALVVVLGRQLSRTRLGLIAGVVFVLLPRITWAGTEGRSYALTALMAVLLTVVFVKAQTTTRRRWWLAYSAVALLSTVVFLYLALVVLAHGVTIVWRLARRDPLAVFYARRWAIAAASAALVVSPLALEIVSQSGQVAWIDPIGWQTVVQVFRAQWFYGSLPFAIVAWALIAVGVFTLRRTNRVALATILPALIVPTLALIAFSVAVSPLYQPRYLTMCAPFVAVAVAAGVEGLRWRYAAASALALLVVLSVPQMVSQRMPEAKENSSWAQVADLISTERAADQGATTAFIYGNVQRHPSATSRVIAYSYPAAFTDSIDTTLLTPAAETGHLWETRADVTTAPAGLAGADVAYLITSDARDLRAVTTAALAPVGWHLVQSWHFTSVHVLKFEPKE